MNRSPRCRWTALLAATALLAGACGDGGGTAAPSPSANSPTDHRPAANAAVASFDLAVADDARFLVGLFTADREVILGGEAELTFFYLGDGSQQEEVATTTATFLPVPGKEPAEPLAQPTVVAPADGAGVYQARVDLDRAGLWGVAVRADVAELGPVETTTQFEVAEEPRVVTVGEPAPETTSPLVGDPDVAPVAIDSRAQGEGEVPDPELHDATVADAVAAGRPAVVVISTPTYCVSQFCGPITETVQSLAAEYDDVAEFIHIEVWKDFEAGELNEAAAAWIQTERGGNEPWTFLVGSDGRVQARWDNVLDLEALRAELDQR